MRKRYSKEKNRETSTAIKRKQTAFVLQLLFIFLLSHPSFSLRLSSTHQCFAFFIHNLLFLYVCYLFMSTCELFAVCDPSLQLTKLKYSHVWKQALSLALPRLCALSYINVKTVSHTYFFHRCHRSKGKSSVVIVTPSLKTLNRKPHPEEAVTDLLYLCLSISLSLFCLALLLNLFSFSVYFYPFSYITSHTHSLP